MSGKRAISERVAELGPGLDGGGSRTLVEVAALVGVSKQAVYQAEARALERLRGMLA